MIPRQNAERWQKTKKILDSLLELPPQKRAAFLDEISADDDDLRREVESFLKFEDDGSDALEKPAFALAAKDLLDSSAANGDLVGQNVGRYKIVREIGRGGMGVVFLAMREDFTQRVALKLIKRGMDSDAILRRFLVERQILASLEHPNIARLLDGGTTADETPFFVMEFVEGVALTEFVKRENLSVNERLTLFRKICAAVAHAHRHLVVHRDLKPSNILVTPAGEPKLLDFGIAKLLKTNTDKETQTQIVFTPEYASPEQVKGEKLTTATDVYSLGVILHEILTQFRPSSFVLSPSSSGASRATNPSGQRTKGEGQRTKLNSELKNIVAKALREEPERRYSSVEHFSEDVRRHLTGLPVTASAGTWTYHSSKFIQRNRIGVTAALLILLTLLGGLAATLYQANIARRERARAEAKLADVRALTNSFLFEFHDAIVKLPGSTPARELVVKRALEYLDKLAAESSDDAGLQRELATAFERIGKIQGNSYYSNLGDSKGAMQSCTRSLEIRQKLAAADPQNRELQNELANSYEGVGDILFGDLDLPNALQHYEKALAIRKPLLEAEPDNLDFAGKMTELHSRLGDVKGVDGYPNLGDTLGAVEHYRESVRLAEKLAATAKVDNDSYQQLFAARSTILAMLQNTVGKSKESLESGRKAIQILETLAARNPNNKDIRRDLMSALVTMRYPMLEEKLNAEAIENARRVVREMDALAAADPQDVNAQSNLAVSLNSLGVCQREAGDFRGAVETHLRALKLSETVAAKNEGGEVQSGVLFTRSFLAQAQLVAGDSDAALVNYRYGATFYEKQLAAGDASDVRTKDELSVAYAGIAKASAAKNDWRSAVELFNRAVPLAAEAAETSPHHARLQRRFAALLLDAGRANAKAVDNQKACQLFRQSAAIWNKLRDNRILPPVDADKPDETARELVRCNF